MPIFEFECNRCGERFENLVRSGNTAVTVECPACHSHNTKKKISSFAHNRGGASTGDFSAPASGRSCSCSGGCGGCKSCSH
ncbi:MAG: FmdB family zinc ribbon protein [Candidatus Roseilinea sp.]|uniref:FmdB family zinc ribbon protein n=1 Tax=Candidatus Roseilinea sp. TaxID=2838777 RepID=UPI00404945C4